MWSKKEQKKINRKIMDMLGSAHIDNGDKISCFGCSTPYCCKKKKTIDLFGRERESINIDP